MNVFKFSTFIKVKKSSNNIKKSIINCYKEKSSYSETYNDFVKRKWTEIEKEQIRTMYSERAVIAYSKISNSRYFMVEIDEHDAIDQVTYEIIVLSSLQDINEALNNVYDDITNKLSNFKVTLIDNKALLFIYVGDDIISNKVMIKSNVFSYSKFLKKEFFRILLLILIIFIGITISFVSSNNAVDNICYSVSASCIFFLISEFLFKFNLNKTIEIKDLTNWVEKNDELNKNGNLNITYSSLENPSV
ncbi:hypothetical protein J1C67_16540 [Clostridium gasigenes]|uniref:hypothetical protein n=1 Tax=Clostridium gasigenes TaxID=94869 RepID=UPI0014385D80|nr:hypothetical protein [Clostridium gasigenes]NKF05690.1 hypothetical protein [Clostridium gasigenes]QSW19124.1 hypothetical protein J1C67_16540 [Clostridium gasigenes]